MSGLGAGAENVSCWVARAASSSVAVPMRPGSCCKELSRRAPELRYCAAGREKVELVAERLARG
jgi:hypothetical protein